jgi:hypothetical protein
MQGIGPLRLDCSLDDRSKLDARGNVVDVRLDVLWDMVPVRMLINFVIITVAIELLTCHILL